ncbi:MAG: ATP-binding protein [Blautia sp.]
MKKSIQKRFQNSLQWKLTLLITLLVTLTCILMYFFISRSAVTGIENLEDYMIQIDPQNSGTPIKFNIDPKILLPELSQEILSTKEVFRIRSIIATAVVILLGSICTYFLTARALKPLKKLTEEICHIQAQNLSEPLTVPVSDDEIAQLTGSFNDMLVRLSNSFEIQKQFSANAAHELRTPLAVLQTDLEVFRKKNCHDTEEYELILNRIQEQTGRLSHLISTLLDMTNLNSVPRNDSISLAALTEEVLCDLDSIADQAHITLQQKEGDQLITGSYLLLYRAVYNLVENAIKYNCPDGSVTVEICQENQRVLLMVKDTGIGIPPEDQEKIFDPFFRVDKSRSRAMGGAGLGLAMVDAIAKEHGGQVKVLSSNKTGSTIALMLPL